MSLLPDALAATLARHTDLSNDRRQTLAVLILGVIQARTVNLTHLAGAFCGPAKLSSNYRRLQRFFQHVRLDADWLARTLVALARLAPPYELVLDRTNWKVGTRHVNLLVLAVVTRRARLPVLWEVLDRGGCSTMAQCMALISRFVALFGKGSIKLLTADREFDGNQWFEFLIENDIPFAIRVSASLHLRLADAERSENLRQQHRIDLGPAQRRRGEGEPRAAGEAEGAGGGFGELFFRMREEVDASLADGGGKQHLGGEARVGHPAMNQPF